VHPKARARAKKHKSKVVVAGAAGSARHPGVKRQPVSKAVVPVAAVSSDSSSLLLPLALGVALGLAMLAVALALTPAWALPRPVFALVYAWREALIFAGCGMALCIGLAITFAVS
jgi:phosphoribosylcarboxyaminoimidazole (NCAIR) mutase